MENPFSASDGHGGGVAAFPGSLLRKGVDPYDPNVTIEKLFGPDVKGRTLQEAIWATYQVGVCDESVRVVYKCRLSNSTLVVCVFLC